MKTFRSHLHTFARRLGPLVPAAAVFFTTGCAGVYTPKPAGEKPHRLVKSDWEGTWIVNQDVARVSVTDAAGGWLKIAMIKTSNSEPTGFSLDCQAVQIMESGGCLFANIRDDDAQPPRYTWARIAIDGDQVVGWAPDLEKFRALVRDGKLKGRLDGDDVMLEPLLPADLQALASGALGVPFDWDKPFVIRRVAR